MARTFRIAAAQMGATHYTDAREKTMGRMLALLDGAAARGAQVVLFPETAFGTFFPRHLIEDAAELDAFFEHGDVVTQGQTRALFERARALGVHVCVGYAEKTAAGEAFNACVFYDGRTGAVLSKYRKVHLPGDVEPFADPGAVNQLEKRYFRPGDLGFRAFRVPGLVGADEAAAHGDPIAGMLICNDRRWAEAWRVLALQGAEVVLCGYNTPAYAPHLYGTPETVAGRRPMEEEEGGGGGLPAPAVLEAAAARAVFQHKLVMQAHSYTNACFGVCAARAGVDDGRYPLIGGSCITGPEGDVLAEAATDGDELVVADLDLDLCKPGKLRTFDFARHRRVEHYARITQQTGAVEPPRLGGEDVGEDVEAAPPTPPRKIRILLVNPNSTPAMTEACVALAAATLPPDVELTGFTAPRPAPSAVEGAADNVRSAAAAAAAVLSVAAATQDAVLVACYSDHALVGLLREELPGQPVVGILEASLAAARTLGGRFGLVATSARARVGLENAVHALGLAHLCAGVASCGLGVLGLHADTPAAQAAVDAAVAAAAQRLVAAGADVLALGCAGMAPLKRAVEAAAGPDVTVVDGVLAGVQHLAGLVRMGGRTAKGGLYQSAAAARAARGQDWV